MRRLAVVLLASLAVCRRRRSHRERGSGADGRAPGRSARARVRSGPGRRRARAADPTRARSLSSGSGGSSATGSSIARRGARSDRADGRFSGSGSSPSGRSAGTSRCSSSGFGATGFARRAVDGRFSPATAAALRRYQRRHSLDPDGIAGPNTFRALAGRRARAAVRVHVVRRGRELLLDRGALPREPVAAGAAEPAVADAGHRPRPAARAPGAAHARGRPSPGRREPRRDPGRDRPLARRLRRRPAACARARVDGVRVPAGRRLERRRDRRDAAAARDVGVRGHGAARVPHAAHVRRQRARRSAVPPLAARRVRRERAARARRLVPGRASGAGARAVSARRSSSSASCSRSTARSEGRPRRARSRPRPRVEPAAMLDAARNAGPSRRAAARAGEGPRPLPAR